MPRIQHSDKSLQIITQASVINKFTHRAVYRCWQYPLVAPSMSIAADSKSRARSISSRMLIHTRVDIGKTRLITIARRFTYVRTLPSLAYKLAIYFEDARHSMTFTPRIEPDSAANRVFYTAFTNTDAISIFGNDDKSN